MRVRGTSARGAAGAGILVGFLMVGPSPPVPAADETELEALAVAYTAEARPLLLKFCTRCHSDARTEAEINFKALATLADARQHPKTWQKAEEMLASGQMPPPETRQPAEEERARLL